jgi:hypothetical protein
MVGSKTEGGDTLIVRKRKWATFFSILISISQQTLVCLLSQFDKRFSQRSSTILANTTTMQLLCLRLSQLQNEGRMTDAMASLAKMKYTGLRAPLDRETCAFHYLNERRF